MANEQVWYIAYNGQTVGPMTKEQLMAYHITPNTQVWREGMTQWQAVYTIPELMELTRQGCGSGIPPQNPGAPGTCPAPAKDKTVAGLFAILVGGLGIQYFYLGKVGGGFICILLTVVTCGLWSILSLIQGIMMLTMTQQDFEAKYVNTDSTFPLF